MEPGKDLTSINCQRGEARIQNLARAFAARAALTEQCAKWGGKAMLAMFLLPPALVMSGSRCRGHGCEDARWRKLRIFARRRARHGNGKMPMFSAACVFAQKARTPQRNPCRRHAGCACFLAFLRIVRRSCFLTAISTGGAAVWLRKRWVMASNSWVAARRPRRPARKVPARLPRDRDRRTGSRARRGGATPAGFGRQQRGFCARSDGLFRARQPTR